MWTFQVSTNQIIIQGQQHLRVTLQAHLKEKKSASRQTWNHVNLKVSSVGAIPCLCKAEVASASMTIVPPACCQKYSSKRDKWYKTLFALIPFLAQMNLSTEIFVNFRQLLFKYHHHI